MDAFERHFANWVIAQRWSILLATLLIVIATGAGMGQLSFNNDNRVYFSKQNPQLLALEALENTFSENENVLIAVAPKDGNVFTRETLQAVQEITERAWFTPYSSRVNSLSNFQHSYSEGDDLIVEDLYQNPHDLSDEQIAKIKQIALSEPLLIKNLISVDAAVTAININVLKPKKSKTAMAEIATFTRQLKKEIEAKYPNVTLHLAGGILFGNAFQEVSQEDGATLLPLMYGILLLTMALLLRSVWGTFATLIIIAISSTTALGLTGWLGISLSASSVNAPTVILTLAVADCIHILASFTVAMRKGLAKQAAIIESVRINFQPLILTSLTTAIGFLSMNFSDAPPFRDLGNIVAMGVMAAMFFALLTLPSLMAVLPMRVSKGNDRGSNAIDRVANFVVNRRKILLPSSLILVLIAMTGMSRIELDDNFIEYFDQRYDIRQSADFIRNNLAGMDTIEYALDSGESSGINNPAYLAKIEEFANWYRQQPYVTHVTVLTDIIKRLNKNLHNDDPTFYKIPANRELAAQYLLMYEMSLPYGLDLNNQINVDKSSTRMIVLINGASSKQIRQTDENARAWLQQYAPKSMQTHGASISMMFSNISKTNIDQMLSGTLIALMMISLLLIAALKSLRLGLLSLVPNLFPALMTFGIWGFFVGEVGLTVAIVGTLTLGIVVDDTVHFLSKYQRARTELGKNAEEAVRYAFHTVGRALVITTVVLVLGFSTLILSGFKINADMGILTAMAISIALILDVFCLPPLLMLLDRGDKKSQSSTTNETIQTSGANP